MKEIENKNGSSTEDGLKVCPSGVEILVMLLINVQRHFILGITSKIQFTAAVKIMQAKLRIWTS